MLLGCLLLFFLFLSLVHIDASLHADNLIGISSHQMIYCIVKLQLPPEAFYQTINFFFGGGRVGAK